MTFFSKAATVAALALGLLSAATSTPGFAQQLNPRVNVPHALAVPAIDLVIAPAPLPLAVEPAQAAPATPAPPSDQPSFASLEAAVAAQDAPESVSEALRCLAASVYYESKGEPLSGQLAVAEVILNRAKSGRFPPAVCAVVTQPGQFSFIKGGRVPEIGTGPQWRTAVAVAQVAMADSWDSPAANALYFHARRVAPGWRATKIASIGNHIFFR